MSEEDLLRQAENALRSFALRTIAVSPRLRHPYTGQPDLSPWTLIIGPEAARALKVAAAIRARLGGGHPRAVRALGEHAPSAADALRQAVWDLRKAGITTGELFEDVAAEIGPEPPPGNASPQDLGDAPGEGTP